MSATFRWLATTAVLTVALAGSPSRSDWPGSPMPPTLEAVVDLTRVEHGLIPVSVTVHVAGAEDTSGYYFKTMGKNDEYRYHSLQFRDSDGHRIGHVARGNRFNLEPFRGASVTVDYRVQPGGNGRHGLQGVVTDDWAIFDGRLFVLPRDAAQLTVARVRYILPSGWTVTSPFREADGWHYVDGVRPGFVADTLLMSCVGAGRFRQVTRRIGETEFRVANFADWDDEYSRRQIELTFRLFEHYSEKLGLDLGSPYSVTWTPARDLEHVYGGAYSNGTCFDHPDDHPKPWRLLAHRLAHSLNKYAPSGMWLRDSRDTWLKEGWPTHMEVVALVDAGIVEKADHWNTVYPRYLSLSDHHPDWDIALRDDRLVRGDTLEFMHYTKAPLATRMLDFLVAERTGRSLQEFMKQMWPKYGWYRAPFPFKEELEEWAGVSFEDFWRSAVDVRGDMVPVWPEYVTPEVQAAMQQPAAVLVGGEKVSGDYLHHLAMTGDFDSYREIRRFLVAAVQRRRELSARGIRLYPETIAEHRFGIPPRARYAIARHEEAYPLHLASTAEGSQEPVRFEINPDHDDGKVFAQLLAFETHYERQLAAGGLAAINVLSGAGGGAARRDGPRLAFHTTSTIFVEVKWLVPRAAAEFEILAGRDVTHSWRRSFEPDIRSTSESVGPDDRATDQSIVYVRATIDGRPPVTRAYWQRGEGPRQQR